jgi:RNA polymerase sigma-70 factor (ECF subfamily)
MPTVDRFRTLYDENHERVRGFLGRLVGPQDCEDLTQVVFAKAAKGLSTFRGDSEVSTWLHRIAANVASDWLRSRSAHEAKLTVSLPDEWNDEGRTIGSADIYSDQSVEQQLSEKDMQSCIRAEIGKLSDEHRDVLMLSALGGLGDDEIAKTLGISMGNVRVRLHRARQEFKKLITSRCDFYRNELSCKPSSPDCCVQSTDADRH